MDTYTKQDIGNILIQMERSLLNESIDTLVAMLDFSFEDDEQINFMSRASSQYQEF